MTAHYQSMHAAVKMLISRIQALHQLVSQMQSGAQCSFTLPKLCRELLMRLCLVSAHLQRAPFVADFRV